MTHIKKEEGFALITVLMLAAMLAALLGAYFMATNVEFSTTKSTMDSSRGFYAAEAGLNIRAQQIRAEFMGYNRPAGTAPVPTAGTLPCKSGDTGADDFACAVYRFKDRDVLTYVTEDPTNPVPIVIPPGEAYQNLNASEYAYTVSSVAANRDDRPEAILDMRFKSRLVPMFQFAAFYNKDLEILPGPAMTFAGPVHSNGDLYVGGHDVLTMQGQVTVHRDLWHGRKDGDVCLDGDVAVFDPGSAVNLPECSTNRVHVADTSPWNGMIRTSVDRVEVPPPESLDPTPGEIYWDLADMRVVLDLDVVPPVIEVRDADNNVEASNTTYLTGCGSAVMHTSGSFENWRENGKAPGLGIEMLEIDVQQMLECIDNDNAVMSGRALDDSTQDGLVWYFAVEGPDSDTFNNYGVRVRNGGELRAQHGDEPPIQGLTVVTNQAIYIQGHYNKDNKKPAAFLADSLNVLSEAWDDTNAGLALGSRVAAHTTINAAFLAGTDVTDVEGPGGQDHGDYNGGLENYPRFHETWGGGRTLTYRGSFVSLYEPRHVDGEQGDQSYSPPIRDWGYDTDFNDASNLPPLSPRFVYLKQELFVREFGL